MNATNTTNATFCLVNNLTSFSEAQSMCNDLGGNLAHYTSLEEQLEVEEFYTCRKYLLPSFHESYWIGLHSTVKVRGWWSSCRAA
jgi:hypothetical protein